MKKISIPEESYWKLVELKAKLHCKTWKELIDLLYHKNAKIGPGTRQTLVQS